MGAQPRDRCAGADRAVAWRTVAGLHPDDDQENGGLSTQVNGQGPVAAGRSGRSRACRSMRDRGSADWRGFLTVERNADATVPARGTLRFSSDLRGLASKLPAPFSKSADAARPLTVTAIFGGADGLRIQAQSGAMCMPCCSGGRTRRILRSSAASSHSAAARRRHCRSSPGLWLAGRLESASISDLLALKWDQPRGRPLHELLGGATCRSSAWKYWVTSSPMRMAACDPAIAHGKSTWIRSAQRPPDGATHVSGRSADGPGFRSPAFRRIGAQRRERAGSAPAAGDPRRYPRFLFDGRQYGHLQAELARGTAGMTLNQFTIQHAAFTAKGRGSWLVRNSGAECRLEFEVDSQCARIHECDAAWLADQRPSWPHLGESELAGPTGIERDRAAFRQARDGRGGRPPDLGRARRRPGARPDESWHLPRRMALDFGDLTGEGLSFDTLRGTFQLTDGDAYTDNLKLRGPAAEIGLEAHQSPRGDLRPDRGRHRPARHVTGSSGRAAGGPAIAAALLLFSRIFKEPLKGATRGSYRVTGSWEEPPVGRIDAQEMKDAQQVEPRRRARRRSGKRSSAMTADRRRDPDDGRRRATNLVDAGGWSQQAREAARPRRAAGEFLVHGRNEAERRGSSRRDGDGPVQSPRGGGARPASGSSAARCRSPAGRARPANACVVFDAGGKRAARYDKIHLFDVDLPGGREAYRESANASPGAQPVVVDTPAGRLGLTVCYDMRFPALFRRLVSGARRCSACRPRSPCRPAARTGKRCCGPGRSRTLFSWSRRRRPGFTPAAARPTATR